MRATLNFPRYDATLNTDWCNARNNAELTLTLRLGFRQINPAGGADKGTYREAGGATAKQRKILKWTTASWSAWKINFCRSAEQFWHGKFWLVNNSGKFPIRSGQTVFIPNVWCKFDIIGADAGSGVHHHVIDVVRLDPTETFFRSHERLYDSEDTDLVQKGTDSAGRPIMQRAHVHEVGHLLGLGHVDQGEAHCPPSNTNASACYGISDVDMNSVMGKGMRLDLHHSAAWRTAFDRFVRWAPVSMLYRPPFRLIRPTAASMQRQYPRTIEEFERGRLATTLLRRRG